jgi:regulator of replication initiation timing
MVLSKTPDEILAYKELYDSEGKIKSYQQVADTFGSQLIAEIPDPVIIKTTFDGSMHFIVRYQGQIYDPLSLIGKPLRDYKILSYIRLKPLTESSSMAGKLYDQGGQVWLSYNGKKFYVEAPQEFGTETIIKGDAPGEIMIKKKDSEVLLAQQEGRLREEYNKQINELKGNFNSLEGKFTVMQNQLAEALGEKNTLKEENDKLDKKNDDLIAKSDNYRKKQEAKIKDLEDSLNKCLANSDVKPSWFKNLIEEIIKRINKLKERKEQNE